MPQPLYSSRHGLLALRHTACMSGNIGRAASSGQKVFWASDVSALALARTLHPVRANSVCFMSSKVGVSPPSDNSAETIFSKIIRKEVPADIVFEDDVCLAFKDIAAAAPVHVLVIPKRRISQLSKTKEEIGDSKEVKVAFRIFFSVILQDNTIPVQELLGHLLLVAADIGRQMSPEGFRFVINDGKAGLQSVYHLHVHVLGGKRLSWPPGV